jgi:hypothetical protein
MENMSWNSLTAAMPESSAPRQNLSIASRPRMGSLPAGMTCTSRLRRPCKSLEAGGQDFCRSISGPRSISALCLDKAFRPIPGLESILKLFGQISPWRIAVWFESTNAWLDNHRPRELLGNEPEKVLRATERYRNSSHG